MLLAELSHSLLALGETLTQEQVDAVFKDCMGEENDDGEIKYAREYRECGARGLLLRSVVTNFWRHLRAELRKFGICTCINASNPILSPPPHRPPQNVTPPFCVVECLCRLCRHVACSIDVEQPSCRRSSPWPRCCLRFSSLCHSNQPTITIFHKKLNSKSNIRVSLSMI